MNTTALHPTHYYVSYGRLFKTFAFPTTAQANAFMASHPGWGLLGISHDGMQHVADNEDKGQDLPPVRRLRCCCCGGDILGRQWPNQDHGWGLGECCVARVQDRVEDMERTYGLPNVHYAIYPNRAE